MNLSIAVHAFPMDMLKLLLVDEILLPKYVIWAKIFGFRGLPFSVEMPLSCLNEISK